MNLLMMYLTIIMLLALVMSTIPIILMLKLNKWHEKTSSFECGMNLNTTPRKPMSVRFFILMILFIVFELEVVMILAMPIIPLYLPQMISFLMIFITILTCGTIYEWTEGALNWKS